MRIPPAWAILAALVPASAIFGEEPKVSGAADSPPILVLVAEQGVDDGAPVAWWTRGGDPRGRTATAPRTAESVLVAEWQGAGIRIAPSDAAGRRLARERIGAASLTGAQARAAGRIAGATIVVHGTSVATTEDESSGMLEQTAGMKP
ncbi:MAG TPA: hypothetical protein VFK90_13215, partial [Anaeromyxobacter sp.]|nr:hypothetical protein [Anaeromyxobacter sp.]